MLSSKAGKEVIVKPVVDREQMTWAFEIDNKPSKADIEIARAGTVNRRGATCLLTGTPMPFPYIRIKGKAGHMGARLLAIVAKGQRGRVYLPPNDNHEEFARVPIPDVPELEQDLPNNPRDFKTPNYGMSQWKDLFTPRQLVALTAFSDLVIEGRSKVFADAMRNWPGANANDTHRLTEGGLGPAAYADAVTTYLAMIVDRMVFHGSSLCGWLAKDNAMGKTMPKQALAMCWDYAEGNPIGESSSDALTCTRAVSDCIDATYGRFSASVTLGDAQLNAFPKGAAFSTDPPYYDNVGYAELSDFFYVWLRRALSDVHPDLFRRILAPKSEELVATPYRHGGKDEAERYFMEGMKKALSGFASSMDGVPAAIYYAYKAAGSGKRCANVARMVQLPPSGG